MTISPTRRRQHCYTNEQIAWLIEWYQTLTCEPLTRLFNKTFQATVSAKAMHCTLLRYKIKCGRTGRFEKGQVPFNKGMKGIHLSPESEFKKGNIPVNTKPVGTERKRADGYIWVKIAEPNTWKEKHVLLYESVHGKVEKGHTIIFIDQDPDNITIENIKKIERRLLLKLNINGYKKAPYSLKSTVLALSELEVQIHKSEKQATRSTGY